MADCMAYIFMYIHKYVSHAVGHAWLLATLYICTYTFWIRRNEVISDLVIHRTANTDTYTPTIPKSFLITSYPPVLIILLVIVESSLASLLIRSRTMWPALAHQSSPPFRILSMLQHFFQPKTSLCGACKWLPIMHNV